MARRSAIREEDTEINLSSMIDCIFILLIFFIVTTVFVEETGLQVNKPDAAASPSLEEQQSVALEILAGDKVVFEGRQVSIAEVTGIVQGRLGDPETPVVIRAHEKSRHGTFVAVWDAAKLGGARTLSFSTVN